ncbi:hypothetical protein A1O3_02207 [Capronia epimyces CBS 606.96]|uniref:Uncharacterized protein n=1 Tax=Capronia epimyces CBS 606.96 TaxID=1182542 RepID=W9Y9C6_9EURO|nr:uncharacterized protein A1O3_02207 [Capronia epimyces CBS 606.96]EXJ89143.1 hypothetical protein A1O3_02207 [Capronia epimyces CBS 606.96]
MARSQSSAFLALLTVLPYVTYASPVSHLYKRDMSAGAKAGLGVGIAVAAVMAVCLLTFFVVHLRRSRHLAQINRERSVLAGEKNQDGSDKPDIFASNPPNNSGMPRRNKSVKDRLMGPLYRGSTIDLMPIPKAHVNGQNRSSTLTMDNADGQPFLHKPWAHGESSPRPSFSSKRATRMMMMM